MAPRGTQASQARRGGPSQSQRRRGPDSEEEDEDYGAMDYDDDEDGDGIMAGASQARVGSQSQADGANRRRAGGTGGLSTEVRYRVGISRTSLAKATHQNSFRILNVVPTTSSGWLFSKSQGGKRSDGRR